MTYKVRKALATDKEWVVDELSKQTLANDLQRPDLYDPRQIRTLTNRVLLQGKGWVVEKDGKRIGVIGGLLHGHIFNPQVQCFTVLFWYVEEEYRNSRAAWLLLKELMKYVNERKLELSLTVQEYSLKHYSFLEKLGFKNKETIFWYRG